VHLSVQQFVGALQFLVPEQQPVNAAGKLDYGGLIGHGTCIVGRMSARASLECVPLVLAAQFLCSSSTGNWGKTVGLQPVSNQCCPRNGKWTDRVFLSTHAPLSSTGHWVVCMRVRAPGKAMKVDPPARIPANEVVVRLRAGKPLLRPGTVGEGGEGI
jgi:hypothetical protein